MILFKEDWDRYPNAIVDTQTSNKSFVRLAALYRDMGIENHTFILSLLNPELQGVDPFDPNLTTQQVAAIAVECKANFWYFLREVARAPGQSGSDARPVRANRGNIALFWLFFNHITPMLIQIRQTGKSFSTDLLMVYLMEVRCKNTQINLLTKDETLRQKNIERLKEIDMELPYYLRQRNKHDTNNTESLTVKKYSNTYQGHLPNRSPKLALNVGRGLTSPIFHIDEAAFLSNIEISLPAALAAGAAARDIARNMGEPYGTIITTTAGKKDDRDGRYIYKLLSESAIWNETLFDSVNTEELEEIVMNSSPKRELRVNCTFNHRQLGYDDAWLKKTIQESMVSGEAADRDFFNVWTAGNLTNPLPLKTLEMIRAGEVKDPYISIARKYAYTVRWYIKEEDIEKTLKSRMHILSLDTSDASGGDDISLILSDVMTGETIAAGQFNETNLITFAEWLLTWFVDYENIVGIIERRSTGSMILDYLILMMVNNNIDPFKRLFNWVVNEAHDYKDRYQEVCVPMGRRDKDVYIKYKKFFGFATSGSGQTSRADLYSTTLQAAAKKVGGKIKDVRTIDQVTSLTTRNGRVDHQPGEHDDLVIAWLLGYWLLTMGKNLSHYGIHTKDILAETRVKSTVNATPAEIYFEDEQRHIREQIEFLYDQMLTVRDEYILRNLETKLRNLNKRLILQEGEKFSVDELMQSLQEQKRLSRLDRDDHPVSADQMSAYTNSYFQSNMFGRV